MHGGGQSESERHRETETVQTRSVLRFARPPSSDVVVVDATVTSKCHTLKIHTHTRIHTRTTSDVTRLVSALLVLDVPSYSQL